VGVGEEKWGKGGGPSSPSRRKGVAGFSEYRSDERWQMEEARKKSRKKK